jgi:hypothetical protein
MNMGLFRRRHMTKGPGRTRENGRFAEISGTPFA